MNTQAKEMPVEEVAEDAAAAKLAEDAFDAGYDSEEFDVGEVTDDDLDEWGNVIDEEDREEVEEDPAPEEPAAAPKEEPADPFAGVPQAVLDRMDEIAEIATKADQNARSASGRATKLKLATDQVIEQQEQAPAPAPAPSDELMRKALTDQTAFTELKEDWPSHASILENMVTAMGSILDSREDAMNQRFASRHKLGEQQLRTYIRLDNAHDGWEATVQGDEFKNWVYDGGPNLDERGIYNQLLGSEDPRADEYYGALLEKYPDWAENKGTLFGTNSAEASISLLDMHKAAREDQQEQQKQEDKQAEIDQRKAKQERLRRNIAPTSGTGTGAVTPDYDQEVNDAFDSGFENGSEY